MPCYHPITCYKPTSVHAKKTGCKKLCFDKSKAYDHDEIQINCNQCIGCRLERSRQWAIRCTHEAQMHDQNCFITLTFDPMHAPDDMSLDVRHFQLFMKRLRKHYSLKKIRFYHCGEYGEKNGRPHFHAILFGLDFEDKKLWKIENKQRLYRSAILEKLWPYGFSSVGSVTFQSTAYVARYILKKQTGEQADDHYFDSLTGVYLKPEYNTMSRRPGIGKTWYDKYKDDVYPHDYVVLNGKKMKPPKYYDTMLEKDRPYEFDEIKFERLDNGKKHEQNNTPERLHVRETVQKAKLKQLPRNLN